MNVERIKLITRNMKHLIVALEKELGSEEPEHLPAEFVMEDFQEMENASSVPYSTDYDEVFI